MSHRTRIIILALITIMAGNALAFLPRIPQSADYHNFADQRAFLGVPNFLNVISNLPFLAVGMWGLIRIFERRDSEMPMFISPAERWPYAILALGVVLTCFGSSYYHWAPDNARLVWDRLPMTLGFMSLLSALIMERIHLRAGLFALVPLLLLGLASVVLWYESELRGAGDLRFYLMVQFYTLALVMLILWLFPARYSRGGDLLVAMGFYVLAKICEEFDHPIFNLGHIVSGHTLKHLAAAFGIYWIFRMLVLRKTIVAAAG